MYYLLRLNRETGRPNTNMKLSLKVVYNAVLEGVFFGASYGPESIWP